MLSSLAYYYLAKASVLKNDDGLQNQWKGLRRRERRYTWPSRPVLFSIKWKKFLFKWVMTARLCIFTTARGSSG